VHAVNIRRNPLLLATSSGLAYLKYLIVRASSSPLTDVKVSGCVVPLTDTVKLLGVTIDRHLTFDSHVQNVCKSAYYHIRALKHIRSSLSTDMARTIIL